MLWPFEYLVTRGHLDDAPKIHHGATMADMAHHAEIVCDKEVGQPQLLAQILEKVTVAGGTVVMEKTWLSREAGYAGVFIDCEGNSIGLQHP